MKFLKKPVPLWSHFASFALVALVTGAVVAGFSVGLLTPPWIASAMQPKTAIHHDQVVTSIERLEQTDLLELTVTDVSEGTGIPPGIAKDIPWLQNARIMVFTFKAQLGVERIDIEPTGDHEFIVTVPEFAWTGSEDFKITRVFNDDGPLSAFTTLPDQTEQQNAIINEALKQKYLDANQTLLRDQAEFYFTKIVKSIDPDATVSFVFAGDASGETND